MWRNSNDRITKHQDIGYHPITIGLQYAHRQSNHLRRRALVPIYNDTAITDMTAIYDW